MKIWPCSPEKVQEDFRIDSAGQLRRAGEPHKDLGKLDGKHLYFTYKGTRVAVARVVWCYYHLEWSTHHIEYKDGNPLNCTIDNLRLGAEPITGMAAFLSAKKDDEFWLARATRAKELRSQRPPATIFSQRPRAVPRSISMTEEEWTAVAQHGNGSYSAGVQRLVAELLEQKKATDRRWVDGKLIYDAPQNQEPQV